VSDGLRQAARIVPYLRPFRWRLGLAVLLVFGISAAEILKPWPLKIVVDNALGGAPLEAFGFRVALAPQVLLVWSAVGLVLLYVVLGALSVASNYVTIDVGQRMVDDFRADLYQHLQRLSLGFHGRQSIGDLIFRLTADTFAIQTLAMNSLFPTISAVVLLVGMMAVMAKLNLDLTLIALAICPLLLLSIRWVGMRIARDATTARERESELYSAAERSVSAIKVIQAFTTEDDELLRFRSVSRASLRANLRLYTMQTGYAMVVSVISAVGTAGVIWLGARGVLSGSLSVGDLIVFTSYLASLYAPIHTLSSTFGLLQAARVGVGRVFEILETAPEVPPGPRSLTRREVRGGVEFRDVSFGYVPERLVLAGVTLSVSPGETIAIVGPTGVGKSTLVGLVARFYDPTAGEVLLDGVDLRSFDTRSLRRQIAMVLQPPLVFPTTLRENVAYGRRDATPSEVEDAIRTAQLDDLLAKLPAGLDTLIGQGGIALSEGEKQRLTIARAIVRDAPVLVLDEPTSALDTETEARLMAALDGLLRGRTAFVIAHRLSTVRHAARIVVLREGRVAEVGTFDELLARHGEFARLHDSQFGLGAEGRADGLQ
jgi:ATP-binding cassette, subfamily B, bacterial